MKHIFYLPASYAALIYALLTGIGLLLALFIGVIKHSRQLLSSHCGPDHYEFWPSISSAIGDEQPERQLWRISFILCTPFRLGASITLFSVFWQNATGGMAEVQRLRNNKRLLLQSSVFLTLLLLWSDLWRLIFAVVWTMVASYENLSYHNIGFCPYVFLCFVLQLTATILVKRNRYNLAIYPHQRDAHLSYFLKRLCLWGQSVASAGVVGFFAYHRATCANGSFSLSTMCEWTFAFFNIAFDASCWFELATQGWWLSGSPSFYKALYAQRTAGRPSAPRGEPGELDGRSPDMMPPKPLMQRSASGHAEDAEVTVVSGPGTAVPNVSAVGGNGGGSAVAPTAGTAPASDLAAGHPPPHNLPPASVSGGEPFLSEDVVLHRFTFCSAPSQLTMWLCDIYWAHLFFEYAVHVIQHLYFQPLVAMSVSWEIVSAAVLGAPILLRIPCFRRWARGPCFFARTLLKPSHMPVGTSNRVVPMYIFFYFCASLTHVHMLQTNSIGNKILGVAAGPLFVYLAIFTRMLYPGPATGMAVATRPDGNDLTRMIYMFPLGLIMTMLLRIFYISHSPLFVEPLYSGVFGITLGIGFTTIIYRHAMFGNNNNSSSNSTGSGVGIDDASATAEREHDVAAQLEEEKQQDHEAREAAGKPRRVRFDTNTGAEGEYEMRTNTVAALAGAYPATSPALLGILFGLVLMLSLTFFISPNYIPRLVAVEPYPASFFVVGAFAAGVLYSSEVLPVCSAILPISRNRGSVVGRFLGSKVALGQSWGRFGVLLAVGTLVMLFGTRQTNFTYEKAHPDYPVTFDTPKEKVLVKHWDAVAFIGNRYLAFGGGLVMAFCVGALYPLVMEITFAHTAVRRQMRADDAVDAETAIRAEGTVLKSFELHMLLTLTVYGFLYVLVISYPFIPLGFLFREHSRPVIISHLLAIYGIAYVICRRMRHVPATIVSDTVAAKRQRAVHPFITLLIPLAFLIVFIGRTALQPSDVSFPEGRTTALQYRDAVLQVHEALIALRVKRNARTDPEKRDHERRFIDDEYNDAVWRLRKEVVDPDPNDKTSTTHDPAAFSAVATLFKEQREEVFQAAEAMTFFSGLIWTVHFGLDNSDVDDFERMVHHARETEAGVVGLLESDSMHLTNGNRDMVEYLSYYLGYRYTDYGPTVLDNTYGCALISRYPIRSVRRYVLPSPLGELACAIHAELDVFGVIVHTYVGHFGNTEHWADGMLQSQYLGRLARENAGPSLWLGYLVTHVGNPERYLQYTHPTEPGKFRDAGLEMYAKHPWERLRERGGYEEPVATSTTAPEPGDFSVPYKLSLPYVHDLEKSVVTRPIDESFMRTPPDQPPRQFLFKDTGRYTDAHPRFEFIDRYCQYSLYKTGSTSDEAPERRAAVAKNLYDVQLFDWWRITKPPVSDLSDTEIQVIQLRFTKHT